MICVSVTPSWTRDTQASAGLTPAPPTRISNRGRGPRSVVNVTSYWKPSCAVPLRVTSTASTLPRASRATLTT